MLGCAVPPARVAGAEDSCQSAAQSTRDADHSVALRNQQAKLQQEFRTKFGTKQFHNNKGVPLETELAENAFEGRQCMKQAWK